MSGKLDGQGLPGSPRTLAGVDLLRGLDAPTRQRIERRCEWRRWNAGEWIIDRDTPENDVYFIVQGRARVMRFSESGTRDVVLDEIPAGGFFGELAAIDGEPRSAHIVAAERTLTACLAGPAFVDMLFENRAVGLAFMRRLTEVVRASTSRIVDLSLLDAHRRIYAELLKLAKTGGGCAPNTAVIRPVPRHGDIAGRTSTTRETVTRIIGELTHRGLLERAGEALRIRDLDRLTVLAGRRD